MFGVVLWSDEQEQKAVIWCEDHGDLAYYSDTSSDFRSGLDAGNWVQFDMTMEQNQRFAHNPKLVCEGEYLDLADALSTTTSANPSPKSLPETSRGSAQVIPFTQPNTGEYDATKTARVKLG